MMTADGLKHSRVRVRGKYDEDISKGGEYYFSTPKNEKMRVIALPQAAIELFAARRNKQALMMLDAGKAWENNNLIFTNPTGGYLSCRTVYDCFKCVVKKIGFPNTRFHDLRHTYVKHATTRIVALTSPIYYATIKTL